MTAQDPVVNPDDVARALAALRERIRQALVPSGRDPSTVRIVAVTKRFGPDAVGAAIAAGLTDVGENYYQEAAGKYERVVWPASVRRHFIGRLQRNKAGRIAALFDVVQTVDDLAGADALDDAAAKAGKRLDVLVQVNAAGDLRQGIATADLPGLVARMRERPHLRLRGLMAMGPTDRDRSAAAFARARACFDELRGADASFDVLSMGMTDDLEQACAAGSTMLRIGTALFGARPPHA